MNRFWNRRVVCAALVAALGGCERRIARQVGLCELTGDGAGLVRIRVHVMVSDHGSIVFDPNCPTLRLQWSESPAFRDTEEYQRFFEATLEVRSSYGQQQPSELLADVEGELKRGPSGVRMLEVRRVYAFEIVPSELLAGASAEEIHR